MRRARITFVTVALAIGLMGPVARATAPGPLDTYATMSDGVKIALAVSYPAGFDAHRPGLRDV